MSLIVAESSIKTLRRMNARRYRKRSFLRSMLTLKPTLAWQQIIEINDGEVDLVIVGKPWHMFRQCPHVVTMTGEGRLTSETPGKVLKFKVGENSSDSKRYRWVIKWRDVEILTQLQGVHGKCEVSLTSDECVLRFSDPKDAVMFKLQSEWFA